MLQSSESNKSEVDVNTVKNAVRASYVQSKAVTVGRA
jgi:hypothetical protein